MVRPSYQPVSLQLFPTFSIFKNMTKATSTHHCSPMLESNIKWIPSQYRWWISETSNQCLFQISLKFDNKFTINI